MRLATTIAGALLCLALYAPVAGATPDGYQPQLRGQDTSDVVGRYLRRSGPDGAQPELAGGSAARHPDSLRPRSAPLSAPIASSSGDSFAWETFGGGVAGGAAIALIALAAAQAGRGRRRLAHR
jgi:hypothetical protein